MQDRCGQAGGRQGRGAASVRRWLLVGLWLLAASLSASPPASAQVRFRTEYYLERDVVEVPFVYKQRQILVTGEAENKKGLTLLFDTGASLPVFDKSLSLGSFNLPDKIVQVPHGELKTETFLLDDMKLRGEGGMALARNILAMRTDLSQLSKVLGTRVDGILGIRFLAAFVTEIDYARKVIRLQNPRLANFAQREPDNRRLFRFDLAPTSETEVPCVQIAGKLHEKYPYTFLFDTGFGGYVSIAYDPAVESGLLRPQSPRVATTSYTVSTNFRSVRVRAPYLMLGEINLSRRVVQVDFRPNDGPTGIFGNRFLQNYKVTLDYPRRKLWLERVTLEEEPDTAEKPSLGLAIIADGRSIAINRVSAHSPADRSGIRPGDVLLSINGQDVREMPVAQAANLLALARGETTLTLFRDSDPNDRQAGETISRTLLPLSPLDWEVPRRVR